MPTSQAILQASRVAPLEMTKIISQDSLILVVPDEGHYPRAPLRVRVTKMERHSRYGFVAQIAPIEVQHEQELQMALSPRMPERPDAPFMNFHMLKHGVSLATIDDDSVCGWVLIRNNADDDEMRRVKKGDAPRLNLDDAS